MIAMIELFLKPCNCLVREASKPVCSSFVDGQVISATQMLGNLFIEPKGLLTSAKAT